VLADRRLKGVVDVAEAMLEDVAQAHQDRQVDAAHLEPIDELLQVDGPITLLGGMHQHGTGLADGGIGLPLAFDPVQLRRVHDVPRIGGAGGRQDARGSSAHRPPSYRLQRAGRRRYRPRRYCATRTAASTGLVSMRPCTTPPSARTMRGEAM